MFNRDTLATVVAIALIALCHLLEVAHAGAADGLFRSSLSKTGGKNVVSAPVVHHIGFWSHQDDFVATGLDVREREPMRESQPTATVRLAIEGKLREGRRIKELFVREQFRDIASGKRIVEIVVTPVIEAQTARADEPAESEVAVTAEYTLHQYQWPDNDYVIICGRHAREVSYRYP